MTAAAAWAAALPLSADITVGPWTFHDDAFADEATRLDEGVLNFFCGAVDLDDALTGYSPDRELVNTGDDSPINGLAANHFQLDFTDLRAINRPGPDLVFFESRYSADAYEISVRPQGREFTPFRYYPQEAFRDTGLAFCSDLFGLEIELDDFGLAEDTVVDALQFRSAGADNDPAALEGDPNMAGVLAPGCLAPPDGDGDGVGDNCDCAPEDDGVSGVPAPPVRLRVEPDRETFRANLDPAQPGALVNLYRGDLGDLHATGLYDLECVDPDRSDGRAGDPDRPGPGRPFYYLMTSETCFGESGYGTDSAGRPRTNLGPGCP